MQRYEAKPTSAGAGQCGRKGNAAHGGFEVVRVAADTGEGREESQQHQAPQAELEAPLSFCFYITRMAPHSPLCK